MVVDDSAGKDKENTEVGNQGDQKVEPEGLVDDSAVKNEEDTEVGTKDDQKSDYIFHKGELHTGFGITGDQDFELDGLEELAGEDDSNCRYIDYKDRECVPFYLCKTPGNPADVCPKLNHVCCLVSDKITTEEHDRRYV